MAVHVDGVACPDRYRNGGGPLTPPDQLDPAIKLDEALDPAGPPFDCPDCLRIMRGAYGQDLRAGQN